MRRPATTASRKIGQFTVVNTATAMIPTIAGTCTANWTGTTRRCPNTSINREICGPMTAADSA